MCNLALWVGSQPIAEIDSSNKSNACDHWSSLVDDRRSAQDNPTTGGGSPNCATFRRCQCCRLGRGRWFALRDVDVRCRTLSASLAERA